MHHENATRDALSHDRDAESFMHAFLAPTHELKSRTILSFFSSNIIAMKILVTLSLLMAAPVTVMSQGGSTPLPPELTTEVSGAVPTMSPEPVNDTDSPTTSGSFVEPARFPDLSMSLRGVTATLSESSWSTFEETYKTFNTAFYEENPQFGVTNLDITLEIVYQEPPAPGRRLSERQLQGALTLVYNQVITYQISPDSNLEPADVVTQPFATQTSQDAFATLLQESGDPDFSNINTVSSVTIQEVAESTSQVVDTTLPSVTESTAASMTDGATEAATTLPVADTTPPAVTESTAASVTDGVTEAATTRSASDGVTEAATTLSASECTTETSALNADTLIQTEYSNIGSAIETDATDDFLGFCNLVELSCEIDANNYSSNLTSACTAAGGQVTTKALSFACSGTLGEITVPEGLKISVSNWPLCIGASCDPNALPQEIEAQFAATANEIVNQIESGLGGGVTCDLLGGGDTATTLAAPTDSIVLRQELLEQSFVRL